jgi:endonuclease/exonuclease/phosphatase (EEP) superfamily protein YafD
MKERSSWWQRLVTLIAIGYPVALVLVIVALRFVGERWWPIAVMLYLPRLGFALPLPFVVLVSLIARRPWLLAVQLGSLWLVLAPLMGLRLGGRTSPSALASHLRIFSYNVDSGRRGMPIIVGQMRASNADVMLLQEAAGIDPAEVEAGLPGFHVEASGQFVIASRFPIIETLAPPKLVVGGVPRSPRFMRYLLEAPAGPVRIYSVHPISPREGLDELRGEGLRGELRRGRLFNPRAEQLVKTNVVLRSAQLQAIAEDAARATVPLVLAGDTNLPGLSWLLAHWFGSFPDGFDEVGRGFGYTFPAPRHPWMRIDRIRVGPGLRFTSFSVDRTPGSDHQAVIADIELDGSPRAVAPAPQPAAH